MSIINHEYRIQKLEDAVDGLERRQKLHAGFLAEDRNRAHKHECRIQKLEKAAPDSRFEEQYRGLNKLSDRLTSQGRAFEHVLKRVRALEEVRAPQEPPTYIHPEGPLTIGYGGRDTGIPIKYHNIFKNLSTNKKHVIYQLSQSRKD